MSNVSTLSSILVLGYNKNRILHYAIYCSRWNAHHIANLFDYSPAVVEENKPNKNMNASHLSSTIPFKDLSVSIADYCWGLLCLPGAKPRTKPTYWEQI